MNRGIDKPFLVAVSILVAILVFALMHTHSSYQKCFDRGYASAMEKIPGALLVNRPKEKGIVPWGYDNKPGVDVTASEIHKGGLFIDMRPFKEAD